jgi:ubiquitin-conjugating enzyme E2 J1
MDTTTKGQIGGLECDAATRRAMAREAPAWTCARCAKSNAEIMRALELAVGQAGQPAQAEKVPEELRLAYREDLAGRAEASKQQGERSGTPAATVTATATTAAAAGTDTGTRSPRRARESSDAWIDSAIYVIAVLLVIFLARKLLTDLR